MFTKGELNTLKNLMQKLDVGGNSNKSKSARRRARKRNRNVSGNPQNPAAINSSVGLPSRRSNRRRNRNGTNTMSNGNIRIHRKEFFYEIKTGADSTVKTVVDFYPDSATLPFLGKLFNMYEKVIFHSISISFMPAVGANTDGLIIFGWDGSGDKTAPTKRGDVAALMPLSDGPVWAPKTFSLNQAQLMSRKEYSVHNFGTEGENPGSIKLFASAGANKVVGEFWVTYDVTLMSPRA